MSNANAAADQNTNACIRTIVQYEAGTLTGPGAERAADAAVAALETWGVDVAAILRKIKPETIAKLGERNDAPVSHYCEHARGDNGPCHAQATTTRRFTKRITWNLCAEHAAAFDDNTR